MTAATVGFGRPASGATAGAASVADEIRRELWALAQAGALFHCRIENQFGRRNLSKYDRSVLALQLEPLYAAEAKRRMLAGKSNPSQKSDEGTRTDEQLANLTGTSRDTIRKLNIEISENECRKEFTKTERLEYARRLALIEGAKAKERMSEGGKGTQDIAGVGETRVKVAQALGTNRETLRQEQFIADNADLLDPADFAEWDEGGMRDGRSDPACSFS